MMRLSDILAPWFHYAGVESASSMSLDSRKVTPGCLFVALPGHQVDGRAFIEQAKAQGAVAALVHTDDPDSHGKVEYLGRGIKPWPVVNFFQLSSQLSAVAAQFYPLTQQKTTQNVPQKMAIIGITGTNGKTSVSQLIAQLTSLLGGKAAVMGTLGNGLWGELVDSGNTTADAVTVMSQLHDFDARGSDICAMEVSSHGLVQGRVTAVPFDIAVFTNLTRDHLDYHGDMAAYASAKKRLFQFPSLKHALLNLDDDIGAQWFEELAATKRKGFSVSPNAKACYYTDKLHFDDAGVQGDFYYHGFGENAVTQHKARLNSPLLGAFNLSNLLAAIGALHLSGVAMADLLAVTPKLMPVAGRMERFSLPQGASLVVDYAHTPDAIEQALKALRIHCHGQLWCVFGCGGDRDKGKRPLMAQAAERFADKLMVTSDNARSEDPSVIISDVLKGLTQPEHALMEVDRERAVKRVAALAKTGDIVLLAGKGHETYQEIAGKRLDYDERALALTLSQVTL